MTAPHMSVADALVAIRSFPRRYSELLAGPEGDDAWDRLVRTAAPGQTRSALACTARAARLLAILGRAVALMPHEAKPSVELEGGGGPLGDEPPTTRRIADVLNDLRSASSQAAVAVDARTTADWERTISADGTDRSARDLLGDVVAQVAAGLREADAALQAARQLRP